jgi:mannose-1-phosphate guanylyltransferase
MLHAVIMAGGAGTRFWPASRGDRPKQLLSLVADTTLVRATFDRVAALVGPDRVWVVTAAALARATAAELPELAPGRLLVEPVGRDTAACAGYACHALAAVDAEAVAVFLPADHVIGDEDRFRATLAAGAGHVERHGGLLTFGIRPTRPETGFGYLEVGAAAELAAGPPVHHLARFVEKPDEATARGYLEHGGYLWNAGIFAWRATDFLAEVARQLPLLAAGLERLAAALGRGDEAAVLAAVYPTLPRISLDFGVMEGAERCWVLPADFPWSDVGSWPALREVLPADRAGNVVRGRVVALDCAEVVAVSDGPVLSVVGVAGLIVVATADGVLVTAADQAQRVKDVVAAIKERGWDEVL